MPAFRSDTVASRFRPRASVLLRSFKPFVDRRSRVLILGTMPGPVALARREYYGFPGNHFWPIMASLFHGGKPFTGYAQKLSVLRKNRVALWDTIRSCERVGASDGAIRNLVPNNIGGLVRKYPNIRAVIVNGRLAEKLYRTYWEGKVGRPVYVMPSTSPANAALGFSKKLAAWRKVLALTRAGARSS